jgi:hypothetical protein
MGIYKNLFSISFLWERGETDFLFKKNNIFVFPMPQSAAVSPLNLALFFTRHTRFSSHR